jgi:putative transposase
MPRTARASVGNVVYHVINRGNARNDVFHKPDDYVSFLNLIRKASERLPMRLVGFCVMTNHFHLVLHPYKDGDLSRWMQWLMTSHVRRYHRHYKSSGHVWQGRFKAFPIQQDDHLFTVVRYVERNPVRAKIIRLAQNYSWSSLSKKIPMDNSPQVNSKLIVRNAEWIKRVNQPLTEAEVEAVRNSVNRGTPYGSDHWKKLTAKRLGLESTMRSRGRPRKS